VVSGTARFAKLAQVLGRLLEDLDLTDVVVAGSSIGGWAAAGLALAAPERVGRLVLIDPAGLDSADHPIADFFSLTPDQLADLSWANPEGHRIDPAAMPAAQRAILLGNREALLAYGGPSMADPALAARLRGSTAPTLVICHSPRARFARVASGTRPQWYREACAAWIMRSSSATVRFSCSMSRQVSLNSWAASSRSLVTGLVPGALFPGRGVRHGNSV
jgi:pimeloyl-ACP methyl ester carboxylesterase